jgi:hypothetical protein
MTMYDRYFDEREEYTTEEVLRRAYALGVASVCGDPDDGAYERLKERSPDTYDRSIVELAYEEGRAEALELEATVGDDEEIWDRLVETTLDPGTTDGADLPAGLPDLLSREGTAGPAADLPEHLDLPSFLRR